MGKRGEGRQEEYVKIMGKYFENRPERRGWGAVLRKKFGLGVGGEGGWGEE